MTLTFSNEFLFLVLDYKYFLQTNIQASILKNKPWVYMSFRECFLTVICYKKLRKKTLSSSVLWITTCSTSHSFSSVLVKLKGILKCSSKAGSYSIQIFCKSIKASFIINLHCYSTVFFINYIYILLSSASIITKRSN